MVDLKVPVGINASHWVTIRPERTVLFVVHNITTLNRLLDVVGLFESDFRVQTVMTSSLSDPFARGLPEVVSELGFVLVPWAQATQTRFDLIVSASHHGNVMDLHGPLLIMSHGVGYTKYSPGARSPEPGARSPEPGARSPEPGARSPFGLSRQWLLYDGSPIADALVFSHPEQVERVAAEIPEALPAALIAGDPCYDRMVVSLHSRQRYRNALGADPRRSLVVVTSTWSTNSLLGSWPNLLRRLLAELPVDRFQVAAIMHPNIWQGHGSAQVKLWLADCLRAGLTVIPPLEGWRAALIAADLVVGDFGAVSCYGAAVGRPVLLAVFPEDQIVPGTAVHRLGQIAPRLDHTSSLRAQVEAAIQTHDNMRYAEIAELVTSVPGESARLLRTACYRLMGLAEPATEAIVAELPTDGLIPRAGPRVAAAHVTGEIDAARRVVRVERFPADVSPRFGGPPLDRPRHLVVHSGHPVRGLRDAADVLFSEEEPAEVPPGRVLAFVHRGGCRIRDVSGSVVDMTLPDGSPVDPVVLASVAYCWAAEGQEPRALAPTITVEVGGQRHQVSVRVD